MSRTKAELDFIDQYTRKLTVTWADRCIREGDMEVIHEDDAYIEHALEKGWLTKTEPYRLTAKGFNTARAFLKR